MFLQRSRAAAVSVQDGRMSQQGFTAVADVSAVRAPLLAVLQLATWSRACLSTSKMLLLCRHHHHHHHHHQITQSSHSCFYV
jgi:hypothetical protein